MPRGNYFNRVLLVAGLAFWSAPAVILAAGDQGPLFGTYIVTAPMPLSSVSTFPESYVAWNVEGGRQHLGYSLPEDVTGQPEIKIELNEVSRSESGAIALKGNYADASCMPLKTRIVCTIRYTSQLPLDLGKVESFLRNKYPGSSDLQPHLDLARFFHNDPGGVLTLFEGP